MNIIKSSFCALMLALPSTILAQNPIINSQFTADPTARVFNGKIYLYPSHDIPSPIEKLKTWFCMPDYHVFSSSNLTDWEDHGVIMSQDNVPWVQDGSYTMWAPDCVCKDGKYYFYFPASPKGVEKGFCVGVAVADHPEGPFLPMWKPIEGVQGIDPCVLVDHDGQAYIYWAGNGLWMAKLKPSMMELATQPQQVDGLPEGFKEGPFAFERNGKYYFTFPWVRKKNGTETLAYAMADHPMGPYTFKGIIMDESPTQCWTNHHSIVQYQGQWYLFYHHNDYSPKFDKNRSVRIDSLNFNADGTIQKVIPTLRGVGVTSARTRIQIDRYSNLQGDARIEYLDTAHYFNGWKTMFSKSNSSIIYNKVDFGKEKVEQITVRAKSSKGGVLLIRADGATGKVIAKVKIPKTTAWKEVKGSVMNAPMGVHNLYVSLVQGGDVEVDWLGFDALPWTQGAFDTHQYRNLFVEMGYKLSEVEQKPNGIFQDVFYRKNKVYFEVGDSMAYISDIKNHDVRTEGMSYGLMLSVQFDKKEIFDRLWRWGKKFMQHQDGIWKGYFAWSCKTDGTRNAQGPASDGELYYVTSLIFASNHFHL